jgi:hypothetical protein
MEVPAYGIVEWLRALLASLSARFASWKGEGEDEENLLGAADPELVAALEFIAALLKDEPEA